MCIPPDIVPQVTQVSSGDVNSATQYYGSGLELENEVFGNVNNEWDASLNGDFLPQEENNWDWSQQLQSSENQFVQQQMMPPVDAQRMQGGAFGNPLAKLARRPAVGSPNFATPGFGMQDNGSWKQQVPFENRLNQPMNWTGNSIPIAPPRPAFSNAAVNTPISSMMAGPSLGTNDFQVAQRLPSTFYPKNESVDPLDQWMKGAINSIKSQVQPVNPLNLKLKNPEGHMAQMKPWASEVPADVVNVDVPAGEENPLSDDDEATKEKKMRRMLSNRASAKRSRQRRQERLGELEIQTAQLRVENSTLSRKYNDAMDQVQKYKKENTSLREELEATKAELLELKLQKGICGGSKQESGKGSAHSAANEIKIKEENFQEAHSDEKTFESGEHEKCSPKSNITGNGETAVTMEFAEMKDMEIATDEWFESLVHCLDE